MSDKGWQDHDVIIIHFGNPEESFGRRSEDVVKEFATRHPEFVLQERGG